MSMSWQKRRSDFNHDWLKNRYLPALAKWINILDDYVEDTVFEQGFIEVVLPQWVAYRSQAVSLIETFEAEMSPSILISQPPLSDLPDRTKKWLSPLLSALWLNRYPIAGWKSDIIAYVNSAEDAYQRLQELIQAEPNLTMEQCKVWRLPFKVFQGHCQLLAKSIELLPSRCLVC